MPKAAGYPVTWADGRLSAGRWYYHSTLAIATRPPTWQHIGNPAWIGLIYISLFSMLIGFFFWYHGLAEGGIAAVGQLQLLQPFLGLVLAAALLQESIDWLMPVTMTAVVFCVARARIFAARS